MTTNTWIFGSSGTGKTTLLLRRALDCPAFLYIDPHGDDTLISHFPKGRDALVIDPTGHPVGWNILQDATNKPLVASLIRDTVRAVWGYAGLATPVMDRVLFNSIAALLNYPGATLLDLERLLTDANFRSKVLDKISDPVLRAKWTAWEGKHPRDWDQLIASTENKAGEFSEDPRIRAIMGNRSTFDLKRMMFEQKTIVLRLPIAELGEQKVKLVGSLFLAHLMAVAAERTVKMPFAVFIDDGQLFDTPILRSLLANGRRLGLSLCLTNQYLAQLSPELRSSLIANSDERIMFRCGIEDSEYLHRTIPADNTRPKLHELGPFETLACHSGKLLNGRMDALRSRASKKRLRAVVEQSRRRYGLKKRG